jgi:hypothetical protein
MNEWELHFYGIFYREEPLRSNIINILLLTSAGKASPISTLLVLGKGL